MRALAVASILALSLYGCGRSNSELTDGGGHDAHPGVGGNGGSGGSGGQGGQGGSGGTQGATCTTACDCVPGLGCSSGKCGAGTAIAYYCCDTPNACPQGSACQTAMGASSSCGLQSGGGSGGTGGGGAGGMGGGGGGGGIPSLPDGGATALCGFVPCADDTICKAIQCGGCDPATKKCK